MKLTILSLTKYPKDNILQVKLTKNNKESEKTTLELQREMSKSNDMVKELKVYYGIVKSIFV